MCLENIKTSPLENIKIQIFSSSYTVRGPNPAESQLAKIPIFRSFLKVWQIWAGFQSFVKNGYRQKNLKSVRKWQG